MKYLMPVRPEEHVGSWFDHHLSLYVEDTNYVSMIEALEEQVGSKGSNWDILGKDTLQTLRFMFGTPKRTIMFQSKRDLIRFKLTWDEDPYVEDQTFKNIYTMKNSLTSLMKMYGSLGVSSQSLGRALRPTPAPTWIYDTESILGTKEYEEIFIQKSRSLEEKQKLNELYGSYKLHKGIKGISNEDS